MRACTCSSLMWRWSCKKCVHFFQHPLSDPGSPSLCNKRASQHTVDLVAPATHCTGMPARVLCNMKVDGLLNCVRVHEAV